MPNNVNIEKSRVMQASEMLPCTDVVYGADGNCGSTDVVYGAGSNGNSTDVVYGAEGNGGSTDVVYGAGSDDGSTNVVYGAAGDGIDVVYDTGVTGNGIDVVYDTGVTGDGIDVVYDTGVTELTYNSNSTDRGSPQVGGGSSRTGGSSVLIMHKRQQAFEVDNVDQLGGEVVDFDRNSNYPRRNSQLINYQCKNSNDSIPVQNSLRELELTRQASEMSNQEVIDNAITFEEWENYEDMESLTVDESQRAERALIEDGIIQDSKRNTRTTNPATERIKVPKNLTTTFNDSTTSYVLPVHGHYLIKNTVIRCVSIAKMNFDEREDPILGNDMSSTCGEMTSIIIVERHTS
ncbi:unnamed protein product [Ambrosiozyma monospora]|uniref:Unnamed protein product n=1 Tax=Ambrosiozyma monospora TaxID=43982 RepID=A0A9W7DJE4_AMBMO|nr:unnamed protein product [Ambrosiozyma monospora]